MNLRFSSETLLGLLLLFLFLPGIGCAKKTAVKPTEVTAAPVVAPPVLPPSSESTNPQTSTVKPREEDLNPKRPPKGTEFAEGVLKDIFFDYDQSDLKPEARRALEENAAWLKKNPEVQILIEGHCDERGTIEYNEALGERRAMSAKRYLVSLGIDPGRIFTISYGELKPFDPGHTEEAWAKNRRAHFKISTEKISKTPTN